MFHIECMVDDKKLAAVLKVLGGLIISMKPPQYVINAEMDGKKIKAVTGGTIQEMLMAEIQRGPNQFTTDDLRGLVNKYGGSNNTVGRYVQSLQKLKIIKLGKKRGQYVKV